MTNDAWLNNLETALDVKDVVRAGPNDVAVGFEYRPGKKFSKHGKMDELVVLNCRERNVGTVLGPTGVGKSIMSWGNALWQKWWKGSNVQFIDRQQEYFGLSNPTQTSDFARSPLAELGFEPAGEPTFVLKPALFKHKTFRVKADYTLDVGLRDVNALESEKAEQVLNSLFAVEASDAVTSATHKSIANSLKNRIRDLGGDLSMAELASVYDEVASDSRVSQGAPKLGDLISHYASTGIFNDSNDGLLDGLYELERTNLVVLFTLLPAAVSPDRPAHDALQSYLNATVYTKRDKEMTQPPSTRHPPVFRLLDEFELGRTKAQDADEKSEMEKEGRIGLGSLRITQNPDNVSDEVLSSNNYILAKNLTEHQRARIAAFSKNEERTKRLLIKTHDDPRLWYCLNTNDYEDKLVIAPMTPSRPIRGDYAFQ